MAGYKDPPAEHRFKPGQSGNPSGYSRRRRFSDAIHELLDETPNLTRALMSVGLQKALAGDHKFWSSLVEIVEGKPSVQEPPPSEAAQAAEKDADAVAEILRSLRAIRRQE